MFTTLTQKTMRRVYTIWVARALVSPIFIKLYAIVGMVFGITYYVSFQSVFANAPAWNNLSAQYAFFSMAFTHTEMAVWALVLLTLTCLSWIGFDMRTKNAA